MPQSPFRKDGQLRANIRAEHVAHAILSVDYKDQAVSVWAVVEKMDTSEYPLQHCTIGTLEAAVYKAARDLGRKVDADEYVLPPEAK